MTTDEHNKKLQSLRDQNYRLKQKLAIYQEEIADKTETNIKYIFYHEQFKKHIVYKFDQWLRSLDTLFKNHNPKDEISCYNPYSEWIQETETLTANDIQAMNIHINKFQSQQKFSILLIDEGCDDARVNDSLSSIARQIYQKFDMQILRPEGDASVITNRQITNQLRSLDSDYLFFLNPGDKLQERALYEAAVELDLCDEIDVLYADEDTIDVSGNRSRPFFKPDWNKTLFLGQNYIGQSFFIKRITAIEVLESKLNTQKCDLEELLFSACLEKASCYIRHLPVIIYHKLIINQTGLSDYFSRNKNILKQYLKENNINADIIPVGPSGDYARLKRKMPSTKPNVTIIIPTHNQPKLLKNCLHSLLEFTDYDAYEVILIDHNNDAPESKEMIQKYSTQEKFKIIRFEEDFNYAKMMNIAVSESLSEIIVLLNDDTLIVNDDWLIEMLSFFEDKRCGVVGAKLVYPNNTIQHAGVILGLANSAGHAHIGLPDDAPGYFDRLCLASEYSAVSGACMAIRRKIYLELGGMDSKHFKKKMNDVDFCLKVRAAGYDVIWTPFAKLIHLESVSCGQDVTSSDYSQLMQETGDLLKKWNTILDDPFYNVNLSLEGTGFIISPRPRRVPPWRLQMLS